MTTEAIARPHVTGAIVVIAVFLASTPLAASESVRSVAVGAGLALAAVVALVSRSAPAIRTTLFATVLFAAFAAGINGGWSPAVATVAACALPLAVLYACDRLPSLRPALPWMRWGRPTTGTIVLAAVTVAGSAVALAWWALAVNPVPSTYFQGLRTVPLWLAVLGVIGGALVNAVWEEALFRGVALTELAAAWGPWPAIVVQAVATGFAHLNGFPGGWWGVAMAGGWGLVLGYLRVRTGGIAVPYLVHVGADATIGILAVFLLS